MGKGIPALLGQKNKSDGTLRENHRLRSHNRLDRECAVNVLTPSTAKVSTFSAHSVDRHYPHSRESVKHKHTAVGILRVSSFVSVQQIATYFS